MEHEQTQQATTSTPLAPAAQSQTVEGTAFRPESIQNHTPGSEDNNGGRDTRPVTSSTERHLLSAPLESHENPLADFERVPPPLPARSRDGHTRRSTHRHGLISTIGNLTAPQNGLDWIVPVNEKDHTRRTLGERLQPTLENAEIEREKYAKKALWTGYALNIAIGLQVLLGALTTGLAAAVTNGRQASFIIISKNTFNVLN
ncbi:hypothetical protein J3R82DRAFT_7652 [Butyriboletus roseoflavus]|nr:hypothetical protein J3R82DRAFT_7652 [Butyriboletus roseoflavus]